MHILEKCIINLSELFLLFHSTALMDLLKYQIQNNRHYTFWGTSLINVIAKPSNIIGAIFTALKLAATSKDSPLR